MIIKDFYIILRVKVHHASYLLAQNLCLTVIPIMEIMFCKSSKLLMCGNSHLHCMQVVMKITEASLGSAQNGHLDDKPLVTV